MLLRALLSRALRRRRLLSLLADTGSAGEDNDALLQDSEYVYVEVPEPVYKMAKGVSRTTGLSLEEVIASEPVLSYWKKYESKVRVKLPRRIARKLLNEQTRR